MKKLFTLLGILVITSTAFAQELLVNPGFESGLAPWSGGAYANPAISTTDPHTGLNCIQYNDTEIPLSGFGQSAPITGGKTYVISFWYKAEYNLYMKTRLWSLYKDANYNNVFTTPDATTDEFRNNGGYLPTANAWTKVTAEMPAGPTANTLYVAMQVYSTVCQFDDFSLMDKATLAVTDVKALDKQVKMNTIVKEALTIFLPERATVNIYTTDGKLVSSDRINSGESINTSSLSKGMYIVTVDNGSAKVSRKVIKH